MIRNHCKRILITAQDPGGALFLLPIIKHIKLDKRFRLLDLKIFAGKYSYDLFKEKKIKFTKAGEFSQKELMKHIKKFSPDLILTSTSFGFSVEKKILGIAKRLKIKTISVIDFWSNYWLRFIKKGEQKNLKYLPDKIIVIDDFMKKEMIELGFPRKRLEVLGNPHFESFKVKNIPKNKKITQILFISQPFREIYGKNNKLGHDEHNALKDILDIVGKFRENNKRINLIIRLHPKDNKNKYKRIIEQQLNPQINIKLDIQSNLDNLIAKSDLILGMSSMVLFRASFFESPVISYQSGIKNPKKDTLISNKLKLSELCANKDCLERKILMALKGRYQAKKELLKKKIVKKYINSNSTIKIADLIYKTL